MFVPWKNFQFSLKSIWIHYKMTLKQKINSSHKKNCFTKTRFLHWNAIKLFSLPQTNVIRYRVCLYKVFSALTKKLFGKSNIILWYYFTLPKEDPPRVEPPFLRQNLGAKTIWVDLTLKMTPPPLILDPIHLGGSALFLYYLSSRYLINKLLRNLTPLWQHILLLY
jgi:hypothetical protein